MPPENLLNLDGEIFFLDKGYWVKFEARRVAPPPEVPHGIIYSVTLHDRNSTRILGFDNAHAVKEKKKGYKARKVTFDHLHKQEKVTPYEYQSASKMLDDFWKEVAAMTGIAF